MSWQNDSGKWIVSVPGVMGRGVVPIQQRAFQAGEPVWSALAALVFSWQVSFSMPLSLVRASPVNMLTPVALVAPPVQAAAFTKARGRFVGWCLGWGNHRGRPTGEQAFDFLEYVEHN